MTRGISDEQIADGQLATLLTFKKPGVGVATNNDTLGWLGPLPHNGQIVEVYVSAAEIPAALGDVFGFQIYRVREGTQRNAIFSATQNFGYSDEPTGFLVTTDDEATYTPYIDEVTGTGHAQLDGLDTAANGDYFYIGSARPRDADYITMVGGEVNAVSSTLTGKIWKGGVAGTAAAWTDASVTDGTASGGATLAQTGAISWNDKILSQWAKKKINGLELFWMRYEVSAKLTTPDTSIDEVDCRRVKLLPYTYTPKTPESYCYEGEYLHIVGPDADSAASDLEVAIKFAYHTPRPAVSSPLSD